MNEAIFYFFYGFAHQSAHLDNVIIFLADYFPYVVVILAGIFLLTRNKKEILLVFFSAALSWFVAFGLKLLIQAPRPFLTLPDIYPLFTQGGFSFPSEHAMFFSALTFEIFLLHRKAGSWFIFFVLLIGVSRIIAGVHFPYDIITGFILGFLVAYIVRKFFSLLNWKV